MTDHVRKVVAFPRFHLDPVFSRFDVSRRRKEFSHEFSRGDGRITELRNPISQASRQASIVSRAIGKGAKVEYLVVMAGRAKPHSGSFPVGVIKASELPEAIKQLVKPDIAISSETRLKLDKAWSVLVEAAFSPESEKKAAGYIKWLDDKFGKKPWQAWLVTALAFATLVCVMGTTANIASLEDGDIETWTLVHRRFPTSGRSACTSTNECVSPLDSQEHGKLGHQ